MVRRSVAAALCCLILLTYEAYYSYKQQRWVSNRQSIFLYVAKIVTDFQKDPGSVLSSDVYAKLALELDRQMV